MSDDRPSTKFPTVEFASVFPMAFVLLGTVMAVFACVLRELDDAKFWLVVLLIAHVWNELVNIREMLRRDPPEDPQSD